MPDDDPTGRCSNCIRLKKECNFFPVDANMNGKGPHPPQRHNSVPNHGRPGQSPSPAFFGHGSYAEPFPPYGAGGHTSFSVPPPETGLGLFNTSTAQPFPETPFTTSYDTPVTTWDSSPHATLPPISNAPDISPYGYNMVGRQFESPRPQSSFRPSPFADSAYASGGKTPNNEISWAPPPPQQPMSAMSAGFQRHSISPPPHAINHSSRESEQPPSLVMSSETASTPTLSEPTTLGSMSAPAPGFWNPYGHDGLDHPGKPFSEPFDANAAWFPETCY